LAESQSIKKKWLWLAVDKNTLYEPSIGRSEVILSFLSLLTYPCPFCAKFGEYIDVPEEKINIFFTLYIEDHQL